MTVPQTHRCLPAGAEEVEQGCPLLEEKSRLIRNRKANFFFFFFTGSLISKDVLSQKKKMTSSGHLLPCLILSL